MNTTTPQAGYSSATVNPDIRSGAAAHIAATTPMVVRHLNRISWSAVSAGVMVSIATYMILSVLGTAIGAGSINPLQQGNPFNGLGTGAAIWVGVMSLVSVVTGAFVAGRHAPDQGGMHGLLSWSVMTFITGYLLASLAGTAIGTAGNVIGKGALLAGSGVVAAAPAVGSGVKDQLQQNGISPDWNGLKGQLDTLLQQSGKAALQPSALNANVQNAKTDAANVASTTAQTPQNAGNDLAAWMDRVKQNAQPALAAADRDALVNIIAARTGKSQAESQVIADNYAQSYQAAMTKYQEFKQQAEQKARQAGDAAAAALARTSWVAFAILLIGAVLAYISGASGRRNAPSGVVTSTTSM